MPALLLLAFLAAGPKPKPHVRKLQPHYWKDAQGQVHMTDAPPPPGAEVLAGPPPGPIQPVLESGPSQALADPVAQLPPEIRGRWEAIRSRIQEARAKNDAGALSAQVHDVVQTARWGEGRRAMLLLPLLGFAFLALIGWWLALGLQGPWRPAALGLSVLGGLALAQFLVTELVHRPQVARLQEDLVRLVQVAAPPGQPTHMRLDEELNALNEACSFGAAPWRFGSAVRALETRATRVLAGE